VVLGAALGFFTPSGQSNSKAVRITCVNKLKRVSAAVSNRSMDSNGLYPMSFYKNPSATLKFPDETNALRYFQLVTNALKSVKVVTCPDDNRLPAANFAQLSNTNISYFIGLDGDETRPAFFLAGDRNLTTNGVQVPAGIFTVKPGSKLGWTTKMHQGLGNVAIFDGSVQELTGASLAAAA